MNATAATFCGAIALGSEAAVSIATGPLLKQRQIVHRTFGSKHGPITRLVSPGDVGQLIKPFIFLDAFSAPGGTGGFKGFGWHPHSGIATVTVIQEGKAWYEETTGSKGVLETGGVEYFCASGGAWHQGGPHGTDPTRGYQLWLSLDETQENAVPTSTYLSSAQVPVVGPARLVLGEYEGLLSAVPSKPTVNYLDVKLLANEKWHYKTPPAHTVGWIALTKGQLVVANEKVSAGELVVLDESDGAIDIEAVGGTDAHFMLGTAVKHPYDLHSGRYSVHTSKDALKKGEAEINRIGRSLKEKGIM